MQKKVLFDLPFVSTDLPGSPRIKDGDGFLAIEFDRSEGGVSRLEFASPRSLRWDAELYCQSWQIDGLYDSVCEVVDSDWVSDLLKRSPPEWREHWVLRHFAVFLDGYGCIEVIAENVAMVES